jgi:hypothetical protein
MPQRTVEDAMKAVADATEQVIKDGGVVHEDAMWDATEMALDGEPKESISDRIRRNRAMPYVPKGGWAARRGR